MASTSPTPGESHGAEIEELPQEGGSRVLAIRGRLDSASTGPAWRKAMERIRDGGTTGLVLDASGIEFCDGAGASLLLALRQQQEAAGAPFELRGLAEEPARLLRMITPSGEQVAAHEPGGGFFVTLGSASLDVLDQLKTLTIFTGELTVQLLLALRRPRTLRMKDVMLIAERAGIGAIPIILLVGFLLGLILAFQSGVQMRRFGAEVFLAAGLGISMFRELGPLMASILLTARSGSAFAAEIGTMKVNEEVDALTTMGLEPVRFLVVPRVLAAVLVVPTLAMLTSLSALVGGVIVWWSLGFPTVAYVNRIVEAVSMTDFVGGIFKALFFGVIVAGAGCLRGLDTGRGAGAVGQSATSAVVTGIVLIAIADGIFAVTFFILGI